MEILKSFSDSVDRILERVSLDPPHRVAARFVGTLFRTGLLESFLRGRKLDGLRALVEHGLSAATVHRLYAATHPRRLAIVDEHRSLDYRSADAEIDALAAALRHRFGASRRAPVALMLKNRTEYVVSWFATFRLGAPSVHVSYRATAEELDYKLEHSGARVVICSEQTREVVERVRRDRPDWRLVGVDVDADEHRETVYAYDKLVRAGRRIRRTRPAEGVGDDATAEANNIVYTSGTTGRPKGTVRNFSRLGVNDLFRIVERLPVESGDRHLVVTPIYHSGGQVFTLLNASLGATLYLRSRFEPDDTLEALSEFDAHSLFLVPTMIRQVLDLPEEVHERNPTPAFRALVSGAAPFPERLRRRAMQRFGARAVHDFYGATELGWVTLINGREMYRKPGSVGRPIGGQEIRIVDDGKVCDPGEVGTIYVRSEHSMEGYLRERGTEGEASEGTMRRGEWMTVEDLGFVDEEGYLFLAGRERDMVITGGVNVYPVEIEDALLQHDAVADAGVVGVDDEEWGERLVAFVVHKTSDKTSVEPSALEEWLRERLAGYKIPKEWIFVDALPRNATGKIEKAKLEEDYVNE